MIISKTTAIVCGLVLLTGAICFAVWINRWQFAKADARLAQWAQQNGFRILDKQNANPAGTGPMAARGTTNTRVMYRVLVEDSQGARRRALIKVGSESRGVLSDDFAVAWEDAAK